MRAALSASIVLAASFAVTACGSPPDQAGETEGVAQVHEAVEPWTILMGVVTAVQTYYSGGNWFICNQIPTTCPESDAHRESTRIINNLSTLVELQERTDLIAPLFALLDHAELAYRRPDLLTPDQEAAVVSEAIDVYRKYEVWLTATNALDPLQVNSAYRLASPFNLMAALADNIFQQALARGRVSMSQAFINEKRQKTLEVNYRLVGNPSTWFSCSGSPVNTVESYTNSFAPKALWMKFADQNFTRDACRNHFTCNISNKARGGAICNLTSCDFIIGCCAGAGPIESDTYNEEVPKILARMNRDSVVLTVRASMEKLVGLSAERGVGELFLPPSGQLELRQRWSTTSYKPIPVGSPDPNNWYVLGTADADGDGDGDIMWRQTSYALTPWNLQNSRLSWVGSPNFDVYAGTPTFGDLDNDKVADIIWNDPVQTRIWYMWPGSSFPRGFSGWFNNADSVWGTGDFDGNGTQEMLIRTAGGDIVYNHEDRVWIGWVPPEWQIGGIGDFNRDGFSDVFWYNFSTNEISIWQVRGTAVDYVFTGWVSFDLGWRLRGIADVDHDGFSDLLWRNETTGAIADWLMTGPNSAKEFTPEVAVPTSTQFAGTIALGKPYPENAPLEVVPESFCGASNGKLRNPGFAPAQQWFGASFDNQLGTFLGDVDGDRMADLVTVNSGNMKVIRSNGNGFGAAQNWFTTTWPIGTQRILADVNADRKADLTVIDGNATTPKACRFFSTGTKFTQNDCSNLPKPWDMSHGVFIGDVIGNGVPSIVYLGNGFVRTQPARSQSTTAGSNWFLGTFDGGRGTFLGDVTGDGKADLVTLGSNFVDIARSTGSQFMKERWLSSAFFGSVATRLGDVNGDGFADLIAIDADRVRVIRSTGTGFGELEVWYNQTFNGNRGFFIGDLDGNVRAELITRGDTFINVLRPQ